jgi:tRNA-dihydrouridine synthase
VPVTAKIRIGWDESSVNATTTARLLEDWRHSGHRSSRPHQAQGYGGLADWDCPLAKSLGQ